MSDRWLADPDDPLSDAFTLGERYVRQRYVENTQLHHMAMEVQVGEIWFHAGVYTIERAIPPGEIDGFIAGVRSALRARIGELRKR